MPRGEPGPNQERGYKATLHNPNVSKTAKENAARVLQETYGEQNPYETPSRRGSASSEESEGGGDGGGRSFGKYGSEPVPSSRGGERNRTNVVRGLKAATHNKSNTEMGRQQAARKLEELGESSD
ncbi:hypothetical protein VTN49DRAFT_500 [Thermomyces lanuginosus]|uniref:uncharacterized protein n=1 Tax=Thermomyces lanuginosus TaxID=5541 RepID=UPI0037430759